MRAQIRAYAAVLWAAGTATALWLGADIPSEVIIAWGTVWFASFGIGEAAYDAWRARQKAP